MMFSESKVANLNYLVQVGQLYRAFHFCKGTLHMGFIQKMGTKVLNIIMQ